MGASQHLTPQVVPEVHCSCSACASTEFVHLSQCLPNTRLQAARFTVESVLQGIYHFRVQDATEQVGARAGQGRAACF